MKETWEEAEFVLQPPLSQKELQCAEQVARELELLVEKVNHLMQLLIYGSDLSEKPMPKFLPFPPLPKCACVYYMRTPPQGVATLYNLPTLYILWLVLGS